MDASAWESLAKKLRKLPIAGAGHFEVDMPPGNSLPYSKLVKILEHIFHELLPAHGYTIREAQTELSKHILDDLRYRRISLAEAEVGIGKTLAYLTAATLIKRGRINDTWFRGNLPGQSYAESAHIPIVISTSSIALQSAIVQDYIPELSGILLDGGIIRNPLTCILRKGRKNYLCRQRLVTYQADAGWETRKLLDPLLADTAKIDLAYMDSLAPYIKSKICVSGHCGEHCPQRSKCRYLKHLQSAKSTMYDFQICNHNYLLADILRGGENKPLIPQYQALIIDEAHKLLPTARQMYGVELNSADIIDTSDTIRSLAFQQESSGRKIWRGARKMADQVKSLVRDLSANIPAEELLDEDAERFTAVLDEDAARRIRAISKLSGDLQEGLREQHVQSRYKHHSAQASYELAHIQENADALQSPDDHVCWLEKKGKSISLCGIPKNLDEFLFEDIWNKSIPTILASGTLSAAGDFARTKRTLGLQHLPAHRLTETSKPSPFNYQDNMLVYLSDKVPFPDNKNPSYLAAVAEEVEVLVRASHGHAAVLFTSYNAMGAVHAMVKERDLPYPLFRMGRGDTTAIDRFKQSGNGILLASGALWEGIDIPGDALSMLIMVRLPFAVPDPISEYERSLYPNAETYKNNVIIPDMQVRKSQGRGRLIRTETDCGVFALLDCRAYMGAPYHQHVLRVLPPCRITDSISDVSAFYYEKKSSAYFKEGACHEH